MIGDRVETIIDTFVTNLTELLQVMGPLAGILLIILESIIPALPLSVFIALNINAFGFLIGFILSYLSTCVGCICSYFLFQWIGKKKFFKEHFAKKGSKLHKILKRIEDISLSNLVVIIALPFTPAFLINIACGAAGVNRKKYYTALFLGKLSIVFFWGFIGKSLLESITDIRIIILISIMIAIMYGISKFVSKKLKIE